MSRAVTAIIPTYNRLALVRRAIDSALRAISPGDEILVVDDGSTDGTVSQLKEYGDKIRVLEVPHGGAGAARNAGITQARNDWVAFLDSDDEWDPGKIATQRALLEARNDVTYVFTDFRGMDQSGKESPRHLRSWMTDKRPWKEIISPPSSFHALTGTSTDPGEDMDVYIGDFYPTLLENFCIPTFTLMFRRSGSMGARFAQDVPTYEDYEFFGRLARSGHGAYLDTETATQHGHGLPRLTSASQARKLEAQMMITARVWGADTDFLQRHGGEYSRHWHMLELLHTKACIRESALAGDLQRARLLAAGAEGLTWKVRALLALPTPVALGALVLYREAMRLR